MRAEQGAIPERGSQPASRAKSRTPRMVSKGARGDSKLPLVSWGFTSRKHHDLGMSKNCPPTVLGVIGTAVRQCAGRIVMKHLVSDTRATDSDSGRGVQASYHLPDLSTSQNCSLSLSTNKKCPTAPPSRRCCGARFSPAIPPGAGARAGAQVRA